MKVIGESSELDPPKEDHRVVSLHVDFGPTFSHKQLNRGDFAKLLREQSVKHPHSFIGTMMSHFADHIEAAAKYAPGGAYALSAPANHVMDATYYGQGSCSNCGSVDDTCCACIHDGITSCEPC
jgi:hypothetical protein